MDLSIGLMGILRLGFNSQPVPDQVTLTLDKLTLPLNYVIRRLIGISAGWEFRSLGFFSSKCQIT